jgi:hypothetical protein
VFDRRGGPGGKGTGFQHLCLYVDHPDELVTLRRRWIELYESGRYAFADTEQPTDVVVDDDGVRSFYALDVNGLEFEFTHVPVGAE